MIHEREETVEVEVKPADCAHEFEMSPLGKRLMEIRKKYIGEGGKLLTPEDLELEIASRRGGAYAREYEDNNLR